MMKKDILLSLYKILKIGTIVIFLNDENENVFSLEKKELYGRLYRVFGIERNGTVKFAHIVIQEARNEKNKNDSGTGSYGRFACSGDHVRRYDAGPGRQTGICHCSGSKADQECSDGRI